MNRNSSTTGVGPEETGFVLVSVAVLAAVLIGFLALGVSMGYLYSARTTAQEIGDAAALAGAYTYITSPTSDVTAAEALAEYHAEQFALDRAAIMGVNLLPADVTAEADAVARRVQVNIESTQPTYFGRVLGIDTADIETISVAEAGSVATGESCPKPFFIPNDALRTPGTPTCPGCDPAADDADRELIVYDYGNGGGFETTPYLEALKNNQVPTIADPDSFFTLKPTNPGQGGQPIASGQYYLIDFDNSNDNDIADDLAGCAPAIDRVECGDNLSVTTGVNNGNIAQGLGLIGNDPGLLNLIPSQPHGWDPDPAYNGLDGRVLLDPPDLLGPRSTSSPQLVSAPIWDVCNPAINNGTTEFCMNGDFPSGTNVTLQIIGFATIFVTDNSGSGGGVADVEAYLIDAQGCGDINGGGGPAPPDGSTVFGLPLRLVTLQN